MGLAAEEAEEDADLAYALQLQQQFDQEHAEFQIHAAQTQHLSPYTKVVLDVHVPPTPTANSNNEEQEGEDDEADYYYDSAEDEEDEERYLPLNQEGRLSKGQYIQQTYVGEVEWRTKHDAEICGHRNTLYLENAHPQHNLGELEGIKMSNPVFNRMMLHAERAERGGAHKRFGKSELATREQVMDPKTRLLLFKMVNAGVLTELNGAVSTGKESVVYHATGEGGQEYAVKIFKTSLNDFKARAKYVEGEHRFRHQLSHQNPRKLIRLWAEKEMRNLKRAERAGLRCPRGVLLKRHVLVMQFVGQDGKPALKLAEANLSNARTLLLAYQQCATMLRKLFIECRLVHADLSEFNMLWSQKELWIIDLAQGVEWDHPNALRFLRDDCLHVTQFFRGRGLEEALTVRGLYEYVTDETERDLALEMARPRFPAADDDQVWFRAFLPQRLSDIKDPVAACEAERDVYHHSMLAQEDVDKLEAMSSSEEDEEEQEEEQQKKKTPKSKKPQSKKAARQAARRNTQQ